MQAVASVIRNRVVKRKTNFPREVMRPWQFTSMSDPKDPEYTLMPADGDLAWTSARCIAEMAIAGELPDATHGATLYWNPRGLTESEKSPQKFKLPDGTLVDFPHTWNPRAVEVSAVIGRHIFLREL